MSEQWRWLESTKQLQSEHFGVDYDKFESSGDALIAYLMTQFVALQAELAEFLQELNWKPWSKEHHGVRSRDSAVGELVDLEHFLANIYCALGVTDREHEARYREKQARNARRQSNGNYTIEAYKCPHCDRELDKPGSVTPVLGAHDENGHPTNKVAEEFSEHGYIYMYKCVSCAHVLGTSQPICRICGTIANPLVSEGIFEVCSGCEVVLV